MQDIDKAAMGKRIRQIRLEAKFRQWELAKQLGTTQSAVHKYEHGVVPEPRRLVALARIGGTSIEWILTGTHWENGSTEQRRLDPEILQMASLLRQVEDRESVNEALRIVREAVRTLAETRKGAAAPASPGDPRDTLRLLESASRIQRAVLRRVARDARARLNASPLLREPPEAS